MSSDTPKGGVAVPVAPRRLTLAACAPASYGFVAPADAPATERMIAGKETDPGAIRAHVGRLLDHHERMLGRAGAAGAQLAVLPEDILRLGGMIREHRGQAFCRAAVEAAYETSLQRLGAVCRRFGMHAAAGVATCRDGRYYNTAVLLDAAGKLVASYDKTHLPAPEKGTYDAGTALPVFDTALGRIGMLICWDIVFPEPYAVLALGGAELILQPTFGHWEESDDLTARCRARDWSVPLAIGMWGGCAGILDAEGNYAARTGRVGDSLAVATLDLATPRKWLWMNDVRTEKRPLRSPQLYGPVARV
ncbi:MAG: N-carbamoyl-D-amino acid hydrolase [Lentisphaerae bacterium ADurb.BinA184]|nr:MAG: N-carbamoyl-D-amino acid hydrolase [Lentisphaerae bacterium ADurb.BinA184]